MKKTITKQAGAACCSVVHVKVVAQHHSISYMCGVYNLDGFGKCACVGVWGCVVCVCVCVCVVCVCGCVCGCVCDCVCWCVCVCLQIVCVSLSVERPGQAADIIHLLVTKRQGCWGRQQTALGAEDGSWILIPPLLLPRLPRRKIVYLRIGEQSREL